MAMSDKGQRFVDHWQSLREGDALPTSQAFLDRAEPALQPLISLNDVDPAAGTNKVALFGTALVDLWKVDLTGKDVHQFLAADQVQRLNTDLFHCALTPCGIWEISTLRTTTGRIICWEMVTLPLSLNGKGSSRIARYHNILDRPETGELIQDILHFQKKKEWLDVGHGVPAAAPQLKAS
jgi:hypothetical protein